MVDAVDGAEVLVAGATLIDGLTDIESLVVDADDTVGKEEGVGSTFVAVIGSAATLLDDVVVVCCVFASISSRMNLAADESVIICMTRTIYFIKSIETLEWINFCVF